MHGLCRAIEDRYKGMCDIAKTRSVVSFGLSFFRLVDHQAKASSPSPPEGSSDVCGAESVSGQGLHFVVQTYNIMLLCSESYMVEPLSLKFLLEHGFDFNKQIATGISYYRGNDRVSKGFKPSITNCYIMNLIATLILIKTD